MGIKLDADIEEVYHRLNELKDTIIAEYQLPTISQEQWEKNRNHFVDQVQMISNSTSEESSQENQTLPHILEAQSKNVSMTNEAQIMLLYAADGDGTIIVSTTFSGVMYQAGGKYNLNGSQEGREIARWNAAVKALLSEGYVDLSSKANHNTTYIVTDKGYNHSDQFKSTHQLDTGKTPSKTLSDLLEHYRQQDDEQEQYAQEIENYLSYDPYQRPFHSERLL